MRDKPPNLAVQPDQDPSRREFLTRAGMLAGGMAMLGVPGFSTRAEGGTVTRETVSGGQYALELDGQFVDLLKSAVVSQAHATATAPGPFSQKSIGSPEAPRISLQIGPLVQKPLRQWIKDTLDMKYIRHRGALMTLDNQLKEQRRLQFNEALISEIRFPACDITLRTPGYLTITITSEYTQTVPAKGPPLRTPPGATQKTWLPSNFRFRIQGLEEACSRVSQIEALTIKQGLTRDQSGDQRNSRLEPTKLEFPHLAITLSESHAGPFVAWFKEKGTAMTPRRRPGALDFLGPNGKDILFRLLFQNLGTFSLTSSTGGGVAASLRTVKVELYCEQMALA